MYLFCINKRFKLASQFPITLRNPNWVCQTDCCEKRNRKKLSRGKHHYIAIHGRKRGKLETNHKTRVLTLGKRFNEKKRKLFWTFSVIAPINIFKLFPLYFFVRPRAIVLPPVFVMDVPVIVNLKSNTTEERFVSVDKLLQ